MRKYTTLMIMALLILLMGCGGGSSNIRSTTTTPLPHEPIEEGQAIAVTGDSTKPDYMVQISGYQNPEIVQFLRKLENQCSCPGDLRLQRIKPTKPGDALKLWNMPNMGENIIFQVRVDNPNGEGQIYLSEQDWPAIRVYDDSDREIGLWQIGSYGQSGRGLFKIEGDGR